MLAGAMVGQEAPSPRSCLVRPALHLATTSWQAPLCLMPYLHPHLEQIFRGDLNKPAPYEGPRDEAGIVKYLKKQVGEGRGRWQVGGGRREGAFQWHGHAAGDAGRGGAVCSDVEAGTASAALPRNMLRPPAFLADLAGCLCATRSRR